MYMYNLLVATNCTQYCYYNSDVRCTYSLGQLAVAGVLSNFMCGQATIINSILAINQIYLTSKR